MTDMRRKDPKTLHLRDGVMADPLTRWAGQAGDDPKFARPLRAPLMLAGQQNPTNAALVAGGRSPVGQPGPPDVRAANTAANNRLPANPSTMVQGPDGVTAPGQRYPGRSLVPVGEAFPTSDARGLRTTGDLGRSFTPPTGGSVDPNTIYRGTGDTSRPSGLATTGTGRELAVTGDKGRAFTSLGSPKNPSFINGISPEAAAYQASRTGPFQTGTPSPAAPAAPGSLRQSAAGAAQSGWGAIKSAGPAIVAGVAGSAIAGAARGIGRDDTPRAPRPMGDEAKIPVDGYAPTPGAQPYNFFTDNEAGRNIGNLASAVSMIPGLGMATGALRSSAAAAVMGAGQGVRTGREESAAPAPTPAAAPAMGYAGDATMPGQDPGRPALRNPNEVRVERQANGVMSFSGGPNIGADGGDISYTGLRTGGGGDRVSTVPGMSRAEIDRTLTNPDGSRWSAGDNAIMAANLRDGVDPYRGTSRAAGERGNNLQNRLTQLAMSAAGTPGRKGALRMLTAMRGDETARRGQDLAERDNIRTSETSLRNSAATAQLAAFNAQREQGNADRNYTLAAGTQAQALGEKYRDNARKEFEVVGEDGKPDLAASKQAADLARQLFPGIESANEQTRNKAMGDASEMHGIFKQARGNGKVGWDAVKFWSPKRPALSGMPDARGGATEQIGFLDGLVTLGASNGDTVLKRPDGSELNLGKLNARQLELLDAAKKSGWGN